VDGPFQKSKSRRNASNRQRNIAVGVKAERNRRSFTEEERLHIRPEFDVLHQRYQQLLRRCGQIARRESDRENEQIFHESVRDMVAKLKRVVIEIERFQSGESQLTGPSILRRELQVIEKGTTQIETGIHVLDQFQEKLSVFDEAFTQLFNSRRTIPDQFLELVERVQGETKSQPLSSTLLMFDSLTDYATLPETHSRTQIHSKRDIYEIGIRSAYLISAVSSFMELSYSDNETLVLAALLQDTGFASLERRYGCLPRELAGRKRSAFRSHPRWSAAVASGLRRCSVDLPMFIAEHHERLNGIGFPNGLRSSRLTMASKCFQIVSCFVGQISKEKKINQNFTMSRRRKMSSVIHSARNYLEDRSRFGEFDESLMKSFVGLIDDAIDRTDSVSSINVELHGNTEERVVPPPKFLRQQKQTIIATDKSERL
jgi:HD-GYP domain-containing protein (c-di-GMP phosphodiesterase class II)